MQSLQQFQSIFKTDPVKFEFKDFADEAVFSAATIAALKDAGIDAIYLKPLSSEQRAGFETSVVGADGKKRDMNNLYARYVALSWVDDEAKNIGNAKEIGQLRADLVAAIFRKVQELNGVASDSVDEAGKD